MEASGAGGASEAIQALPVCESWEHCVHAGAASCPFMTRGAPATQAAGGSRQLPPPPALATAALTEYTR